VTIHVAFVRPVLLGDGQIVSSVTHGHGYSLDDPWGHGQGVMVQPLGEEGKRNDSWRTVIPWANIACCTRREFPL
jgi:hypothetical protein